MKVKSRRQILILLVCAPAVGGMVANRNAQPASGGEPAGGIGPDVIVGGVAVSGFNGSNSNDIVMWGTVGDITAYSFATTSCNVGDAPLAWLDCGDSNNPDCATHPVIAQNMFRLKDGRFEQIGQAWLKHGFCALSQNLCGQGCSGTGCDTLGVGCSDPYTAHRNGDGGVWPLGPKSQVNAATGVFPFPATLSPTGNGTISGRLQVHNSDVTPSQNPGALYFLESQYVTQDDSRAGNKGNNASWRQVTVANNLLLSAIGSTAQIQLGINAWHSNDATIQLDRISIADDGTFWVGTKVNELGEGMFHYEYAIQNFNSDRSGRSFSVPIPPGVTLNNIGFHDVDYHSGEVYDGADWTATLEKGLLTWQTQTVEQNENANALRWGTLYNFRFDADAPPTQVEATLGLFMPGTPETMAVATRGPLQVQPCPADLDFDGQVAAADLAYLLGAWGPNPGHPADFNGDEQVNAEDLANLLGVWGPCE